MNTFKIDVSKLQQVRTKKLTFKGETKEMPVYRIPINTLFYNDQNGRIATSISKYKSEGMDFSAMSFEGYNNLIEKLIKESASSESYKNTLHDIQYSSQKEPGVVLTDGRVIDGNRRFTCLRQLYRDNGNDEKYKYFEAVVLDAPEEDDINGWKAINSLELELQIGTDEKVGYDPIDWLVKVYYDVVKTKSYGEKEYCRLTKMKGSEFRETKIKAEIMEEFLEFFNKKEQFHIAKDLKLDGPLTELAHLKKKLSPERWKEVRPAFFVYLNVVREGDKSRNIRNLIKKIDDEDFEKLIIQSGKDAERLKEDKNAMLVKEAKEDHALPVPAQNEGDMVYKVLADNILKKQGKEKAITKPVKCCKDAINALEQIDEELVAKLNKPEILEEYKKLLAEIYIKVSQLIENEPASTNEVLE